MKSLNQEVDEIRKANISKTAKKQAYAKLGITPYEISLLLMAEMPTMTGARAFAFTFGVEIECNVARGAIRMAAEQTGMAYEYQHYNHTDGLPFFKFVSDSSVHGSDPIECVSPVLQGKEGKNTLKTAIETLNQAGATVNRTCGLHVHIGASKLTGKQYANVFANYYHLERLIDTFMAPSRRANNNMFCGSVLEYVNLQNCNSVAEVQRELGHNRYFKINPMSYNNHKTIEFRQHQGTTDFTKIINWITFCGKLVEWSKKNRLTADITSIDEIPFLTAREKAFFKKRANELN